LNWNGIDFTREQFDQITSIDKDAWKEELKLHEELFQKLEGNVAQELANAKAELEKRLSA
jgi:phosphoenolpyruvate carboxykinase (GTP)